MTSEPPKIIGTKHTSPLTTVIAPSFGGPTATAGDLPEPEVLEPEVLKPEVPELGLLDFWLALELPGLLLLEEQEPRRKIGDAIKLMFCAVPVGVAGNFV